MIEDTITDNWEWTIENVILGQPAVGVPMLNRMAKEGWIFVDSTAVIASDGVHYIATFKRPKQNLQD